MCGIVGILGKAPVAPGIVAALKRLEYRGYDSAGVATLENGEIGRRRAPGKLKNLEERLAAAPLLGTSGIGHTRWATHGAATDNGELHAGLSPKIARPTRTIVAPSSIAISKSLVIPMESSRSPFAPASRRSS